MNFEKAMIILDQVQDFLDEHADVYDGPEGDPKANQAMQLAGELERVIYWLDRYDDQIA